MNALTSQKPADKFALGRLVATPGALNALNRSGHNAMEFVQRHCQGDWGDVGAEDARANDEAVAHEGDDERQTRVLSAYVTSAGDRIWIITEADRSSTCVLLPDEY